MRDRSAPAVYTPPFVTTVSGRRITGRPAGSGTSIRRDALKAYIILLANDGAFKGFGADPLGISRRVLSTLSDDVPGAVGELLNLAAESAINTGGAQIGAQLGRIVQERLGEIAHAVGKKGLKAVLAEAWGRWGNG